MGGISGIGLVIVKLFILEGVCVVVMGCDEVVFEWVKVEFGEYVIVFKGDVWLFDDMCVIVVEVNDMFGGFDVVFVNVGWVFLFVVDDIDDMFYNDIMDVNVKGVVFMFQVVLLYLCEGLLVIFNILFVVQIGKYGILLIVVVKVVV